MTDPLSHPARLFKAGIRQQDQELLSAGTPQLILVPQLTICRSRDPLQHPVSLMMSQGIVDPLEVIDIEHQQTKWRALPASLRQHIAALPQHPTAIVDAGQLIGKGQTTHPTVAIKQPPHRQQRQYPAEHHHHQQPETTLLDLLQLLLLQSLLDSQSLVLPLLTGQLELAANPGRALFP